MMDSLVRGGAGASPCCLRLEVEFQTWTSHSEQTLGEHASCTQEVRMEPTPSAPCHAVLLDVLVTFIFDD